MTNYVNVNIIALLPEPDWTGIVSPQVHIYHLMLLKMLQTYDAI